MLILVWGSVLITKCDWFLTWLLLETIDDDIPHMCGEMVTLIQYQYTVVFALCQHLNGQNSMIGNKYRKNLS